MAEGIPRYLEILTTDQMALLRTEIKEVNGLKILRVFVKDYPDSVEFPLELRYVSRNAKN